MHEVCRRPITAEEHAYLAGWGKSGCLLSFLLDKSPNSLRRLVDADLAAGETEVLTFSAARCAKGCESGYFFVLDGGDGWFLGLEGPALSDAEEVESGAAPAGARGDDAAEMFPARVEVIRAPKSGLVHAVRLYSEPLCSVERVLQADRLNWDSVLFRSSWERLEEDVRALPAAPAATVGR